MGFVFCQVYDDKSSRSSDSLNSLDIVFRALTIIDRKNYMEQNVCTESKKKFKPQIKNARSDK